MRGHLPWKSRSSILRELHVPRETDTKGRMMRYRQLPRTDIQLSEICFGAARFVPPNSPSDQWKDGFAVLDAAIDAGVNVIHSSEHYRTFEALSSYMHRSPKANELHHIIKVQSPDYLEAGIDIGSLRTEIENLLRKLNTDHLAVMQHLQRGPNCPKDLVYNSQGDEIRIPAMPSITDDVMALAEDLKDEGKIGTIMTFPHTMGFARAILAHADIDGVIHFFDLLETEMMEFFDEMTRRDMGFIAVRPLLQGMLTDRRVQRDQLSADDPKSESNWDPWYELLERVKDAIGEQPENWAEFALQFSLAPENVTTSIVRLNTLEQVASAVSVTERDLLPAQLLADVDEVVRSRKPIPKETLFYGPGQNAEGLVH